ncbi:hypothetical protein H257_18568 [Aphanomyces astaci]|uniref:Uncharacterized protein n=1 Tax=Aphanomyces astaci TaxID=112090 RepID=W4FCD8_APHAT|nr:hypothetical protein H257_18568 [Aphanomyces astaci]ETV64549.1 hypothetical protein H257_18568 [Aphanomyces astaci]|eukprot:XP_009845963.1 hypothetical protein H257_18568 [Aphanomyces astaci]
MLFDVWVLAPLVLGCGKDSSVGSAPRFAVASPAPHGRVPQATRTPVSSVCDVLNPCTAVELTPSSLVVGRFYMFGSCVPKAQTDPCPIGSLVADVHDSACRWYAFAVNFQPDPISFQQRNGCDIHEPFYKYLAHRFLKRMYGHPAEETLILGIRSFLGHRRHPIVVDARENVVDTLAPRFKVADSVWNLQQPLEHTTEGYVRRNI